MDEDTKFKLEYYRREGLNEHDLLMARLTGFLTVQSFLVLAYSGSMVANPSHARVFQDLFPPTLCAVGLILSLFAATAISAADKTINQWNQKLIKLLGENLKEFAVPRDIKQRADGTVIDLFHNRSVRFATWAPPLFVIVWITFSVYWFIGRPPHIPNSEQGAAGATATSPSVGDAPK